MIRWDNVANPITYYHANEFECLAIIWALGEVRHNVYWRECRVETDSNVLARLYRKGFGQNRPLSKTDPSATGI